MRRVLKALFFVIAVILVSPVLLLVWIEKYVSSSEILFAMFAQSFAIVPGIPGRLVRAAYYYGTLDQCSSEVHIGFGSIFVHRGARVSARVSTGAYCLIGHADIGEGVRMASRVSIPSGKRQHFDDTGSVSVETRFDRVHIGENVWVGEAATIIANVGRDSVVSAGAVVVYDAPAGSIVGGNPARVLRELGRRPSDQEVE